MQIIFVDEAIVVLVDHVKRFLELLNLCLVKHGKYVRGRALRTLLGLPGSFGLRRHAAELAHNVLANLWHTQTIQLFYSINGTSER